MKALGFEGTEHVFVYLKVKIDRRGDQVARLCRRDTVDVLDSTAMTKPGEEEKLAKRS